MSLQPEDITIAVTVYSRHEFVLHAIRSALDQTVPVKVIVVEDCGPNPNLREMILDLFSERILYFRNQRNRGLFDNWNACMEYCTTPWISILHDDDFLRPNFVESMLDLAKNAPGRALYFGRSGELTADGQIRAAPTVGWKSDWREIDSEELAEDCFLLFPGQLFKIEHAQALGGVRTKSYFTGDWDLWFRLTVSFRGAQSVNEVSVVRTHEGDDRGTSRVDRMGWKWALDNVQRKRNLNLLRRKEGVVIPFDRRKPLNRSPIPTRKLISHAFRYSRRILKYNTWLFTHSKAPHCTYLAVQWVVKMAGPKAVRICSRVWNWLRQ